MLKTGAATIVLLAAIFVTTSAVARGEAETNLSISPETVQVGLNFAGSDVAISGSGPAGTEVILTVDGPPDSVKMKKMGKVMGLFWMTVDQAKVQNVPSFHVVLSSKQVDELLSREEQVELGVDPAATAILSEARVVGASNGSPLPEEKAAEFASALRDTYIKDGRYAPCVSCHSVPLEDRTAHMNAMPSSNGVTCLEDGRWDTSVNLESDAALGDYSVRVYYVEDGQVVRSDAATFTVKKVGMVEWLGSMAQDNAALYASMSLGIVIAVGMLIGYVSRRRGIQHFKE
jgi:hypothetical protein